jgi:predicted SAM-dependent methyltransferase
MIKKLTKWIFIKIDSYFKTSLYKRGRKLRENYYTSDLINAVRRKIEPARIRLKYKLNVKNNCSLKLHLGCGERYIDGYINIDLRKTVATDLVCDIRKLPYRSNSIEIIETYHVIEHIPKRDLIKAFKEWHRILYSGGKLIVECPDFDRAIKEYLNGNDERLYSIYGRQRFPGDSHYWGYNSARLRKSLEEIGFTEVIEREPQDYHKDHEPCLRIEATK